MNLSALLIVIIAIIFPLPTFAAQNVSLEMYGWKFGDFNTEGSSLLIITLIIGFVDGFNPCAMSILLFLISLLLEMKAGWKRWYLGAVFLFTSGLSYFLFLGSWLKINQYIGLIPATRAIIALAAWVIGIWTLRQWWQARELAKGCKVENREESQRMFKKIQEILHRSNLFLATLGIAFLALSVNLFELLCSAALPATYTNILASSSVSDISRIGYLLVYVLVFIIDDLLVFSIAMVTFQVTGITNKYNSIIKLISGIIMLILALWIGAEVMQGLNLI